MTMDMPGYQAFNVMGSGTLYFPISQLTLEHVSVDPSGERWYGIYRIGPYRAEWLIYYGTQGTEYVRFAHGEEDALSIARAWLERGEV